MTERRGATIKRVRADRGHERDDRHLPSVWQPWCPWCGWTDKERISQYAALASAIRHRCEET